MLRNGQSPVDAEATNPFVRPRAFGDSVYDILLGRIMSLEIGPGERLAVDQLARDFQVSQTPIREALGRLEALGLVVRTHLVGYSAAPQLTREQFEDLYDLRLLIEPVLASRAASRADQAAIDSLRETTEGMEDQARSSSPQAKYDWFARLDSRFHEFIALASGNRLHYEILSRLHIHVHIFRVFCDHGIATNAVAEHREILTAIANRDPAGAAAAMHRHIESSRDGLSSAFG